MLNFFRRLFTEQSEGQENPIQQPIQTMEELRDLMDVYFVFDYYDDKFNNRRFINRDENSVVFELQNFNFSHIQVIEKNVISSLKYEGVGRDYFNLYNTQNFSMRLDHYETFFDSQGIKQFKNFLDDRFTSAAQLIRQHPNDSVYETLLIRNVDSFQTVLKTFRQSVSATSSLSLATADLFEEILTSFCKETVARSKVIKELGEESISELDASLKDELMREVEYQRKISKLDHQTPFTIDVTKNSDNIGN